MTTSTFSTAPVTNDPSGGPLGGHGATPAEIFAPSASTRPTITPLSQEFRTHVETASAAHHLNRRPQTLREWACKGSGPVRPINLNGRLAWPVAEIKRVLGVTL